MTLADLLKDSDYKLTQFSEDKIKYLEKIYPQKKPAEKMLILQIA